MTQPSLAVTNCSARSGPAGDMARWSAGTLLGVLVFVAVVLVWRRLAGALASPLPTGSLVTMGLLVAAMAAVARVLWHYALLQSTASAPRERLMEWLPLPAVVAVGVAAGVPGTSPVGLVALGAILVLEEGLLLSPGAGRRLARLIGHWPRDTRQVRFDPPQMPAVYHGTRSIDVPTVPPADEVTQQLTRSRSADSGEYLTGWLRVGLSPGQRTANVHIAFCPPFEHAPTLEATQTSGPTARIKTVQLLPFGARLDLKLSQPSDEPTTVVLQFFAQCTARRQDVS